MLTAHYRKRLSEFVRTSTAYDLIHEEHARMIEYLCDEVERLGRVVQQKEAQLQELKLMPHYDLNIDRAQLQSCSGDKWTNSSVKLQTEPHVMGQVILRGN
jgi:hypothetical protein